MRLFFIFVDPNYDGTAVSIGESHYLACNLVSSGVSNLALCVDFQVPFEFDRGVFGDADNLTNILIG